MSTTTHLARWNKTAAVVAATTLAMVVVYVMVMRSQGDSLLPWVVGVLVIAAGLAIYGAFPGAAFGPAALSAAGMLLVVMGVLGAFSIGLPLLVAGVAASVSAWRQRRRQ